MLSPRELAMAWVICPVWVISDSSSKSEVRCYSHRGDNEGHANSRVITYLSHPRLKFLSLKRPEHTRLNAIVLHWFHWNLVFWQGAPWLSRPVIDCDVIVAKMGRRTLGWTQVPVVTSLRKRYGFNAGCEGYPRKSVSAHVITQADTDLLSYPSQRALNPYLS